MLCTLSWRNLHFKANPVHSKPIFTLSKELPSLQEKWVTHLAKLPSHYQRAGILATTNYEVLLYKHNEFAQHVCEAIEPNFLEVKYEDCVPCVYFNSRGVLCRQPLDRLYGAQKVDFKLTSLYCFQCFYLETEKLGGVVGVDEFKKKKVVIHDRTQKNESAVKLRGLEDPRYMRTTPHWPYNVAVKDGNLDGRRVVLKLYDNWKPEFPVKIFGLGNKEAEKELRHINSESLEQQKNLKARNIKKAEKKKKLKREKKLQTKLQSNKFQILQKMLEDQVRDIDIKTAKE